MFSLCIPTLDRFDDFLDLSLSQYINYKEVKEIIITDENGNDIEKIKKKYQNNDKLVLIKNEKKIGPFLNKLKSCSYAKNEWIVLLDSDNFATEEYFNISKNYILNTIKDKKNIILSPSKASPNFDYSHLSGFIYRKGLFDINKQKEINMNNIPLHCRSNVLMNTGNYVINKFLIENLNLINETENIDYSYSCDVIFLNTLLFEQLDLNLHVVPNLEYNHVVHNKSTYSIYSCIFQNFNEIVYERFSKLK